MIEAATTRVTFIIPVRNDAGRLQRCLASIAANDYPAHLVECIVVDNGSTDPSPALAQRFGARVLSLTVPRVSALRNRGALEAAGELLAFVDADHEIATTWIRSAVESMSGTGVGAVGALYLAPPDGSPVQAMYGILRGRTVGRSNASWLGSGNLVVRHEVFRQLSGFDERLETCEDVDFCQRLRAAGWRLVADERLVNVHLGDPASLRAVFTSERWRGRDNLRVSLRRMPALRDWPSIVIPVLGALALIVAGAGAVTTLFWEAHGVLAVGASVAVLLGLSGLRAGRMAAAARLRRPGDLALAFAVALAYDLGRASSLLRPAGHRERLRSLVDSGG